MVSKGKTRFHFCNQKKEIVNLKNEKKEEKRFCAPYHSLQDLFECSRVEISKISFILRVFDPWERKCAICCLESPLP